VIVYGDAPRRAAPAGLIAALRESLRGIAAMPPGIDRHAALAAALIASGELAQGLADAAFAASGEEAETPQGLAGMAIVQRLASALAASWDGAPLPALPAVTVPGPLPPAIEPRRAEGFCFYALYPEAYLLAARASGLGPGTLVIGLRSIGLPLAAMVATGLGAAPPVTLRPIGHPFARHLSLSRGLADRLRAAPGAVAIVDEGPGLSGSTINAVADFLEDGGIAPDRLHVFPGHGGAPGPQASPRHRARWGRIARHLVEFDQLLPARRLEAMASRLVGPARMLRDLSGGAWRDGAVLPAMPQQERRKFLLEAAGSRWLLKFVGLGEEGLRKAAMARRLAAAGFAPAVAGHLHGFLLQPWLDHGRATPDLPGLAHYLRFRATTFAGGTGASAAELWEMACHNAAEAGLPPPVAPPDLDRLDAAMRRCAIDGRLHAWEWLRAPEGGWLKADAIDHHAAHDLIGCQDIAWDIAGGAMELGFDAPALAAATGLPIDAGLLAFYRPCYAAFQLGLWTMAGEDRLAGEYARRLSESWPAQRGP
jgi:hypothetical protein